VRSLLGGLWGYFGVLWGTLGYSGAAVMYGGLGKERKHVQHGVASGRADGRLFVGSFLSQTFERYGIQRWPSLLRKCNSMQCCSRPSPPQRVPLVLCTRDARLARTRAPACVDPPEGARALPSLHRSRLRGTAASFRWGLDHSHGFDRELHCATRLWRTRSEPQPDYPMYLSTRGCD
jgi:hypothetical protein